MRKNNVTLMVFILYVCFMVFTMILTACLGDDDDSDDQTATMTPTQSFSGTPTESPTQSPTVSLTASPTPSHTSTPIPTATPTPENNCGYETESLYVLLTGTNNSEKISFTTECPRFFNLNMFFVCGGTGNYCSWRFYDQHGVTLYDQYIDYYFEDWIELTIFLETPQTYYLYFETDSGIYADGTFSYPVLVDP